MSRKTPLIYPGADLYLARYLLIDHLRLASSRDRQSKLQKRHGTGGCSADRLFRWEGNSVALERISPVLRAREFEALRTFDRRLSEIATKLPSRCPTLTEFQERPEWSELVQAAQEALASMEPYDMPVLPDADERRRDWQARHVDYLHESEPTRCPCCCHRTRGTPGDYGICGVCYWEDDAQDEDDSERVWGGPNGSVSLSQARENFIVFGAAQPRGVASVRAPTPQEI